MAIVRNDANHPIELTGGGVISPGESRNVDPTAENEAIWISVGALVVIDPDVDPPVPPDVSRAAIFTGGMDAVVSSGAPWLLFKFTDDGWLAGIEGQVV